jgi:hypothetical protein
VLVVALTAVEVATLSLWLPLAAGAAPFSRPVAVSAVVLTAGLQVEHFLTDIAVNGAAVTFPLGQTLVVSITEAAVWLVWLGVTASVGGLRGVFVGAVALAVALTVQHTAETNALNGAPLDARLFDPATVGFSLVTAAGATAWLTLNAPVAGTASFAVAVAGAGLDPGVVGLLALFGALLTERVLVVQLARRRRADAPAPRQRRYTSRIRIR